MKFRVGDIVHLGQPDKYKYYIVSINPKHFPNGRPFGGVSSDYVGLNMVGESKHWGWDYVSNCVLISSKPNEQLLFNFMYEKV